VRTNSPGGRDRRPDPATPNTSGAIAGAALAKLGILDEIKGKTRHAALAVGGELVAKGEVELGFFNLSEIPKGVTVAGPLPGPLQGRPRLLRAPMRRTLFPYSTS